MLHINTFIERKFLLTNQSILVQYSISIPLENVRTLSGVIEMGHLTKIDF